MRHWLLRRPPHYTDIQPTSAGRQWEYNMVHVDVRLKENDVVYLVAAYGELYGWGTVDKKESYQDSELGRRAYKVTVSQKVIRPDLAKEEEVKRDPELAKLYDNSDRNLIELGAAQVNAFNRLLRSKGVDAPADAVKSKEDKKPALVINYPHVALSHETEVWLKEAYDRVRAGKKIDPTEMRIKLWDQLPEDFNYREINRQLMNFGTQLTLLGILHVDPLTSYVAEADQVIRHVRELIKNDHRIETLSSEKISEETGIPEERVKIIFSLIHDLGRFWNGASGDESGGYTQVHINDEDIKLEYLKYKGVEPLLEKFYQERGAKQFRESSPMEEATTAILPEPPPVGGQETAAPRAQGAAVGDLLNSRYRLLTRLPTSGMGRTFTAEDVFTPSKRKCVVKELIVLSDEPEQVELVRERFEREAVVLERLSQSSPQIPNLYAHFSENGKFYLAYEWIPGDTVARTILLNGPMDEATVKKLLRSILRILEYVHSYGVIHRDIKPENVVIREMNQDPVLIDYGAIKEIVNTLVDPYGNPSTSIVMGTRGWMPLEQAAGNPVFSSDLYSLALTAIYMLTGRRPQDLKDPLTGDLNWRTHAGGISDAFAALLDKASHWNYRERFLTAREMLDALDFSDEVTVADDSTSGGASDRLGEVENAAKGEEYRPWYAYDLKIGDGTLASSIDQLRAICSTSPAFKSMRETTGGHFYLYFDAPIPSRMVNDFAVRAGIINPSIEYLGPTPSPPLI